MNTTDTNTSTWLGQPSAHYGGEVFPDGKLNAKQLHTLLNLDDRQYGRITATSMSTQVISQITDDIVEVNVHIGKTLHVGRQCTLWIDSRGRIVASALFTNDLSTTMGQTQRMAESYWTMPDQLDKFSREIITTQHESGMWGLGDNGAIPQTRNFIREHYAKEE